MSSDFDKLKQKIGGGEKNAAGAADTEKKKPSLRQGTDREPWLNKYISEERLSAMELRLRRAGNKISLMSYFGIAMGVFSVVAIGGSIFFPAQFYLAIGGGILLGLIIPHMVVSSMINKRADQFTQGFPDALDLLARGVKTGRPITETVASISAEIEGPVGEEFKAVTERMRIGKGMTAALQDMADATGIADVEFFCVAVTIQRETGGNLAETLELLSSVLRSRAQMKLKVRALSSEARASAYILSALPFLVFGIISVVNPQYVSPFLTDPRLTYIGIGGLVWMGIGGFIMAQMVNFKI